MSIHVDDASVTDSQAPTVATPSTVIEQISVESEHSSIPWPGSTYIILSVSTGKVIAFKGGKIALVSLGGHDANRWDCVENNGWLGFQCPVSSKFLGCDNWSGEGLCCKGPKHHEWENFCVRQRPQGGYVLLASHSKGLKPVGVREVIGEEEVGKVDDWESDASAWKFIRV